MRTAYQNRLEVLPRHLITVKLDAILAHETVYFTKEMKSGYEAGANIRSTGQKALFVQELYDHFKDKRPYDKALVELERQVVGAFK
ncbi:hypothetical protein LTR95_010344, partial [Oleoguttula sp. CCFEE 5521]